MEFVERARIRLDSWIHHNDHHTEEYELFADQLEAAGKKESAQHVRQMIEFSSKSTECLKNALKSLE